MIRSYSVYILRCADNSFYTGVTRDIQKRFQQHCDKRDGISYTARRLPVTLVFVQEYAHIRDAIAMEKKIKGWRREKKIALIEGRYKDLPGLSRKKM